MENITIGQVFDFLKYIVEIAGIIGAVYVLLMKGIKKVLKPMQDDIRQEKEERIKSELITFMYLAENGGLSEEQSKFAHELYDKYTKMGLNSYVHDKFEKLKKEGKI